MAYIYILLCCWHHPLQYIKKLPCQYSSLTLQTGSDLLLHSVNKYLIQPHLKEPELNYPFKGKNWPIDVRAWCVCVCVFLKPAVLSHEWFLMKLNRYITQCLSSWVPHDVSSQGESFRFKSAVRTSVHYVSFPDVAICSLTIPWMFWNYLKAIGSNGKKGYQQPTHTLLQNWKINICCILDMPWNLLCHTTGDIFYRNPPAFQE